MRLSVTTFTDYDNPDLPKSTCAIKLLMWSEEDRSVICSPIFCVFCSWWGMWIGLFMDSSWFIQKYYTSCFQPSIFPPACIIRRTTVLLPHCQIVVLLLLVECRKTDPKSHKRRQRSKIYLGHPDLGRPQVINRGFGPSAEDVRWVFCFSARATKYLEVSQSSWFT